MSAEGPHLGQPWLLAYEQLPLRPPESSLQVAALHAWAACHPPQKLQHGPQPRLCACRQDCIQVIVSQLKAAQVDHWRLKLVHSRLSQTLFDGNLQVRFKKDGPHMAFVANVLVRLAVRSACEPASTLEYGGLAAKRQFCWRACSTSAAQGGQPCSVSKWPTTHRPRLQAST